MHFAAFFRDERASVVPVFAFSLVPMIALAGASLDVAEMTRARAKLQIAVDSTALAVNHQMHTTTAQSSIQNRAQAHFAGQVTELENAELNPVDFSVTEGRVEVSASATFTPAMMDTLGLGPVTITAEAVTVVGDQALEVALVLDNSGSMAGTRIDLLEEGAKSLVSTLFAAETARTRVKVALVPFSGAVNVGPANATQTWMDRNAISPIHSENFNTPANRFTLYSEMSNTPWAGCVEVRPNAHAATDSFPEDAVPASLFVPMFAPDETDKDSDYINNYLSDDTNCTASQKSDTTSAGRQSRVCKYKAVTALNTSTGATRRGPNYWCDSNPIVPLTNDKTALDTALNAMVAKGYTNIHEGLMWGWRALSPTAPFTEGQAYETPNLRKYIVLMTDGENTITGRGTATHNKSNYSAYGFAVKGRLGTTSGSTSTLQGKMNDLLETGCENAKQAGIEIYTIAYQVTDETTLTRLRECASTPAMAFSPKENSELVPVFRTIAQDLGKLRLTM